MKLKQFSMALVAIFAVGFAPMAMAGSIVDTDGDDVPDVFDNCTLLKNSVNAQEAGTPLCDSQRDTDDDGFGNRCDADFDQSGDVQLNDFLDIITFLGSADPDHDLDCDNTVQLSDFLLTIGFLGSAVGPAGPL